MSTIQFKMYANGKDTAVTFKPSDVDGTPAVVAFHTGKADTINDVEENTITGALYHSNDTASLMFGMVLDSIHPHKLETIEEAANAGISDAQDVLDALAGECIWQYELEEPESSDE